jgi:hypothetical protein
VASAAGGNYALTVAFDGTEFASALAGDGITFKL